MSDLVIENNVLSDKVKILDHPLISSKLTIIRDKACGKEKMRSTVREIGMLLTFEATKNFPIFSKKIETPIGPGEFPALAGDDVVIVPILRAGLGLSDGVEAILPEAAVGHIGLYRDKVDKKPIEYLVKLPPLSGRKILLVDPLLASGHSAVKAIDILIANGAKAEDITLVVMIAVPEGIDVLAKAHPNISLIAAACDERLNENVYIVPGMGDAGDRLFGTLK